MKPPSLSRSSSSPGGKFLIPVALFLFVATGAEWPLRGSDWPHLLGPARNAVYEGPALAEVWPAEGPAVMWKREVGQGYSNPIVGEGKLILCHRIGEDLVVECLEPRSGSNLWSFKHAMKFQDGAFFDSGPRATPAIKNGRLFVHNTDGYLVCLDLLEGKKLWSHHTRSEFRSGATWHGSVSSPLVTDKAVLLQVGGSNAAVVAFAPESGDVLWQAFDERATASSPVLASFGGQSQVLVVTRSALHGLDPDSGKALWQFPTRRQTSGDVYAANPVVAGDEIFLSGWYKLGALLLRIHEGKPQEVWHRDDAISTHYAAAIIFEGYIYGFHGHAWEAGGPNLRCVELATGKLMWEEPATGSGTICRSGNQLLILSDTGELQLAKASPQAFKCISRAQVVGRTTRSYPALADGFAYVKGPKSLVCLDLRAKR
jgi:outer membrane protein assembly factor BamB